MSEHRALRYMSRFRCIGPACEASCCSAGWQIQVDEPHYLTLEQVMGRTVRDRARFRDGVCRVTDGSQSPQNHALMVLDDAGGCSFLDPGGTCSVHRRFGESVLSNTCAIFPRKVSLAHDHLELAGLLSCPEVARQLYREPDATTIDALDPLSLRNRATQHVPFDSTDLYDQYLDDVRAIIVGLLETPGYPLSSRLFFVGWFAEQTRAAFHKGAGEDATDVLAAAITRTSDDDALASWHRAIASLEVATPRAGWVIVEALKQRVELPQTDTPFRDLVRACFAGLGAEATGDTLTLEPSAVYAAYRARQEDRDSSAIERMFTSYAIDYWLKDYYTGSQDLAVHSNKLVLRVALLRFLLFTHPSFDHADPARTLVEVTYKLARAIEHDRDLADSLDKMLERLELTSLAHAMFLMKL